MNDDGRSLGQGIDHCQAVLCVIVLLHILKSDSTQK